VDLEFVGGSGQHLDGSEHGAGGAAGGIGGKLIQLEENFSRGHEGIIQKKAGRLVRSACFDFGDRTWSRAAASAGLQS